jgi:sec-independent protein translocase protein TatA
MTIGGLEWPIVILVIVLLLFGAKKIPEFARNLGRAVGEFRRGRVK